MMKFQRRILPTQSPSYLEMEEYTSPSSSRQSISINDSVSDLSDIGSMYSLASIARQRSDSLTNLFHMSEDNASVSNSSIASYSLSQNSSDHTSSITIPATVQTTHHANHINGTNSIFSRRSAESSQKSFPMKTAESVLNSIGINRTTSNNDLTDRSGLIENTDDDAHVFCDNPYTDSSDENELDMISLQTGKGLKKTVLTNVDRLLNTGSKQMKL